MKDEPILALKPQSKEAAEFDRILGSGSEEECEAAGEYAKKVFPNTFITAAIVMACEWEATCERLEKAGWR